MEIYNNVLWCLNQVVEKNGLAEPGKVKAIGITNQRETTVAFDRTTGKPLNNAIVWLDKRTDVIVHEMNEKYSKEEQEKLRERCGLPINTYFSAVKMRWLLQNAQAVKDMAASDGGDSKLVFGTIDTWLIAKLTGLKNIVTDSSNASRTMLMNLHTLEWCDENLTMFGIKKCWLPEIKKSSSDNFGVIAESECSGLKGVGITGVLGDQQAACLGHLLRKGQVKTTYGTGCFILQNVGEKPVLSKNGLLGTVCYRIGDKTQYALEGAVEIAGAAIEWAKSVGII